MRPQPDGTAALAWAAVGNDLEMADLLIGAGADSNPAKDYGVTALSGAPVGKCIEGRFSLEYATVMPGDKDDVKGGGE